jgi:hypothetical protein
MFRFVSILFIFISFTFLNAFSQNFEGVVKMKIESEGESVIMDYMVKGDKIRIELPDQSEQASMVMNLADRKMLIIMHEEKMYMEHRIPEFSDNETAEENDGDITITNETKNIHGFTATKWIVKNENGDVTEAWITNELGSFFAMDNPMAQGKRKSKWESKLAGGGFFPLLVVTKDSKGKEKERMEIVTVDKRKLNESDFNPPAGYQKLEMPGMGF